MFQLDHNIYAQAAQQRTNDRLANQRISEGQQGMQLNDEKIRSAKIERAVQYLGMATPENWGAIRQQAIAEGLGSEQTIPMEYNADWVNQTRMAFQSASSSGLPSSVQEYQFWKNLPATEQGNYLAVKRNPYLNLGDQMFNPYSGASLPKGVPPEKQPELMAQQKIETERAKTRAEKEAMLASMESKMPELEQTVLDLSELGKKATYGYLGRLEDTIQREAGFDPGEDAVARTEYIAKVDNQILPLLRDTFGAAFTQKEGESLKATLGDPNLSPKEKDAALRSFIDQKKATVESLKRELQQPTLDSPTKPRYLYNESLNKTKIIYPDGREEIVDGRQ